MKSTLFAVATGLIAFTFAASGQNAPITPGQAQRDKPPYAWGDKNKDGICDFTGKPVAQGRTQGGGRRMGRGRGQMRGMCTRCGQNQTPAATPSPAVAPKQRVDETYPGASQPSSWTRHQGTLIGVQAHAKPKHITNRNQGSG